MSTPPPDSIETILRLGHLARRESRLPDAKPLFASAVEQSRIQADKFLLAQSLTGLGQIERDLNETSLALDHYREAVALYRELKNPLKLAHTARHVGDILRSHPETEHQFAQARSCYEEALTIYRSHSETPPLDLANCIRGFALLSESVGNTTIAMQLWHEAKDLYAAVNVQPGVDESESRLSKLAAF